MLPSILTLWKTLHPDMFKHRCVWAQRIRVVFAQPPPELRRWQHIVGCPRCHFEHLLLLIIYAASVYPLSLLQLLWQTLGCPAGDALMLQPVACFVLFCFIQGYPCQERDLCGPVVFVLHLAARPPLSGSIFTTEHPAFGLSWYQVLHFWILRWN